MSPPTERERRFADYLAGLVDADNRAALAALRRGLGKAPGQAAEMHPYLAPWLPPDRWREDAYYLVASLFGWHPAPWRRGAADGDPTPVNLGVSFARLAREVAGEGVERRFVALLNADRDDLPDHLRHAVGLLRSRDLPLDWAQLLHDVQGWDWPSRSVQRDWARAFWGRSPAAEDAATGGTTERAAS